METFCETVQFYLRHLEDSVYPVMTEDQFAVKLFPMYRYFVTVWLRNNNPEVRQALLGGGGSPWSSGHCSPACAGPAGWGWEPVVLRASLSSLCSWRS